MNIVNGYTIGPNTNLSGANLEGVNLMGSKLVGANLEGANLMGVNLEGADLEGVNLMGSKLVGAKLMGANLAGANLAGANLRDAYLAGANLEGAVLIGADLEGADLRTYGDMVYLKTMQIDKWQVGYTYDTLQVGCQTHAIEKWSRWDTEVGRIWVSKMDNDALSWAERHLNLILQIIQVSPAKNPKDSP
jgi:hypothetical protein